MNGLTYWCPLETPWRSFIPALLSRVRVAFGESDTSTAVDSMDLLQMSVYRRSAWCQLTWMWGTRQKAYRPKYQQIIFRKSMSVFEVFGVGDVHMSLWYSDWKSVLVMQFALGTNLFNYIIITLSLLYPKPKVTALVISGDSGHVHWYY